MSTRGAIARRHGYGWQGRYHHFDSYPTGLGKTLWHLSHQLGLKRMLELLLDEHPAGWSTINGRDFTKTPGYVSPSTQDDRPACYCHGERSEDAQLITGCDCADNPKNPKCDPLFLEWVYVFDEESIYMSVLSHYNAGGHHPNSHYKHRISSVINLTAPEPDWNIIQYGFCNCGSGFAMDQYKKVSKPELGNASAYDYEPGCVTCIPEKDRY